MRSRWRTILTATAVLPLFLGVHAAGAQPAPGTKSAAPAAKVGDEVITLEEVEQAVRPQLANIEEQRYALLDGELEQLIGNRLLTPLLQSAPGVPTHLVGTSSRSDSFVDIDLSVRYRYNDWLALDARFSISHRNSDIPDYRFNSYRASINFLIGSKGSTSGRSPY